MLSVGVDAWNLLGDRRGIGRYLRAVLREWSKRFSSEIAPTLLVPEWPAPWFAARYRAEASAGLPVRHRAAARGGRFDVLFFPFNGMSWSAPGPKVAVLHDASLFALPSPEDMRERELRTFRRAVSEGAHVITVSNFSKFELMRYLDLPAERIDVVPHGVELPAERATGVSPALEGLTSPYLLFVSEFEERKGIDVLLTAAQMLPRSLRDKIAVVLAGDARGRSPAEPGIRVFVPGFVDDATLGTLYRGAAAFIYPSRYEGFGMPVLEAMAHGTAVIASDAGAIPEAGGNAARYFASGDAASLARAIEEVLGNPGLAQDLRTRGLHRARAMPWTATASQTLAVLHRVAHVPF